MKPSIHRPQLFLLALVCLLGFSCSLAQSLLESYQDAAAALRQSVSAFPTDQVESLDALRRAEDTFGPLGEVLEPALRSGIQDTLSRAEEAIVNQSEADLQVQVAVLQGGFGRAIYQQALRDAADGDAEAAQNLLNVLGQDLGFANPQFRGTAQGELQGAFEARLAQRSLTQLGGFGGDLGSRYRTLAQVYGYLFLVQDSPRLPPETRTTVVSTIQALVSEQPTGQGVTLLRAQLGSFARRAEQAEANAGDTGQNPAAQTQAAAGSSPAEDTTATSASQATTSDAAASNTADGNATTGAANEPSTDSFVPTVPGTTLTEDIASGAAEASDTALLGDPVQANPGQDSSLQNGTGQSGTGQPSAVQSNSGQSDSAQARMSAAFPFLTPELYAIFLMAAGLLALVGLVQLVFAPSSAPWRDAALALLLLPAVAEGLVVLAGFLAPLVGLPLLEQAAAYSLFVNPVMQLVWTLLTTVAVLCLAASWRTVPAPTEHHLDRTRSAEDEPSSAEHTPAAAPRPAQATRSSPLTTGNLNWDDDF